MADQYVSTSRLANVIQLIALGRQSGILRVVRGHGAAREMGQIQFIEGQPAAALLGQLTGPTAINVLTNWGESLYMFDESEAADSGSSDAIDTGMPGAAYGAWPSGDAGWSGRVTTSRLNGGPPGGYPGGPASAPGSYPSNYPASYPGGPGSWPGQGTAASLGQVPRSPTPPPASYGGGREQPGSVPSQPGMGSSYPSGSLPNQPVPPSSQPTSPGIGVAYPGQIPRRTSRSELTDPLPLDRRERMVLLLVDGRRSVADLSRLTRRSEGELIAVLGNLKMLGLVE